MSGVLDFLAMLDIFGTIFNFRYKERERYQTAFGGFLLVLFIALALGMGIYYFIPFIERKNYTIVYYTMNLAETEAVDLFASQSNIAIGLSCENNKKEKRSIFDLLDLKSRFVLYEKNRDGDIIKHPDDITTHKCTYEDFYNKYDAQFDYLGASKFECIPEDKRLTSIQGIYADRIFTYFEWSVLAKEKTPEFLAEVEDFLFKNDCKVQIVYTDIIIDLDNYENPVTQYLNEIFIQLNPVLFIKRNVFFMNQDFTNDDFLMFVFGDSEKPEIKPLYSRYEEYSLYKGMNRASNQPEEYHYFSKLYIRADTKKTIIKRKYQKFMEFYADASSLLIAIYEIVGIIMAYFYSFYGIHDVSKAMFFFKDLEDPDSFNISKKSDMIRELISITDMQQKVSENNQIEVQSKGSKDMKNFPPKKKETERQEVLDSGEESNQKDVQIYNNNRKKQSESKGTKSSSYLKQGDSGDKKYNKKYNPNQYDDKYDEDYKGDYEENYPNYKANQMKRNKNSGAMLNFRYNDKNDVNFSESIGTNMDDYSEDYGGKKKSKKAKVENYFNFIEVLITQVFRCCLCENLKIKFDANEKANELLFKKMDIITHVRNQIMFDSINQTMIDADKKTVFNFLGRPVISLSKKGKTKGPFDEFYKNYSEKEFNKYFDKIQEIAQKPKKDVNEKKLVSMSNEALRTFVQ